MEKIENKPILYNNIHFFKLNIQTLYNLRPKVKLIFKNSPNGTVSYHHESENKEPFDPEKFIQTSNELQALNTSIILNCFSLFESSFEWYLLQELNTKNLTGIQEKIILKYIEDILKVSSESNYSKEFKFITGKSLRDFFSDEENELYNIINSFYTLRHILVHGSSSKKIVLGKNFSGHIQLDETDLKYQNLVELIKKKINLKVSPKYCNIDLLLHINEIADLLFLSVITISNKFVKNCYSFKSIKDFNLKPNL